MSGISKPREGLTKLRRLQAANLPSILSIPARYSFAVELIRGVIHERTRLFDRNAVAQRLHVMIPSTNDKRDMEPRKYMAVILAPYLTDSGRVPDWGDRCPSCSYSLITAENALRVPRKILRVFTKAEALEHVARTPLEEDPRPGFFTHVPASEADLRIPSDMEEWWEVLDANHPEYFPAPWVRQLA